MPVDPKNLTTVLLFQQIAHNSETGGSTPNNHSSIGLGHDVLVLAASQFDRDCARV